MIIVFKRTKPLIRTLTPSPPQGRFPAARTSLHTGSQEAIKKRKRGDQEVCHSPRCNDQNVHSRAHSAAAQTAPWVATLLTWEHTWLPSHEQSQGSWGLQTPNVYFSPWFETLLELLETSSRNLSCWLPSISGGFLDLLLINTDWISPLKTFTYTGYKVVPLCIRLFWRRLITQQISVGYLGLSDPFYEAMVRD